MIIKFFILIIAIQFQLLYRYSYRKDSNDEDEKVSHKKVHHKKKL